MVEHIVDASEARGRVDIRVGVGRRRRWSGEAKGRMVAESYGPGAVVSEVARSSDVAGRRGADVRTRRAGGRPRRCCLGGSRERLRGNHHRDCRRGGSCGTRCQSWLAARCAAGREGGDMIAVPAGVKGLVTTKPVGFRKGGDGLVAVVRETLREDPFSGTIFIFRAKRADRVKILAWDGSGLILFWKRLEHGAFKWPPVSDGVMRLTPSQLAVLVDGMDWS